MLRLDSVSPDRRSGHLLDPGVERPTHARCGALTSVSLGWVACVYATPRDRADPLRYPRPAPGRPQTGHAVIRSANTTRPRDAQQEGSLADDVDPALLTRLILGMTTSLIEWYRADGTWSIKSIADATLALVCRPAVDSR